MSLNLEAVICDIGTKLLNRLSHGSNALHRSVTITFHQKCTKVTLIGTVLRTSQVQIDAHWQLSIVDVGIYVQYCSGGRTECGWLRSTKLDHEVGCVGCIGIVQEEVGGLR